MPTRPMRVIVVGLGAMGGAAAAALAGRGASVVGLERFGPAHDRGSSHGESRIVREAYFEHPDYVPLLRRATVGWGALEADVGRRLFFRTGLVLAGPPDGTVVPGVRRAAREHDVAVDELTAAEAARRYPPLTFGDETQIVFEPGAGWVAVEDAVLAHQEIAHRRGADLRFGTAVRSWSSGPTGVSVETDAGRVEGDALVVCAGAWAGRLLADLGLALEVRRKVMLWLEALDPRWRDVPVFGFEEAGGFFYGFPAGARGELKVAEHSGGRGTDPDAVDRSLRADDATRVLAMVARHLPGVAPVVRRHAICLYTMTPDEHAVVDRHPLHPRVVVACGFSGHGFKLAPTIGSLIADLALDHSRRTVPLFSIDRFTQR